MASTINSDNGLVSGSMGLKYSADATGNLVLQTAGNTVVTLDTGLNANFTGTVSAVGNVTGAYIKGNGSLLTGIAGGPVWQNVITSNTTVSVGNAYPVNTTSTAVWVTLPSSPGAGNVVILTDYARTWTTNNVTLNPNGLKIQGSTSNVALTTNGQSVNLVYVDSTQGWLVYASGNPVGPYSVDYLVVAGGGGGGNYGGGGGAGGYVTGTSYGVTPGTSYSVTVGGGGAGATGGSGSATHGTSGSNSTFNVTTAIGGGGGGGNDPGTVPAHSGYSGGSGGGASTQNAAGTPGAGTAGQGNPGGSSASSANTTGAGGGGGAGATGGAGASPSINGPGGAGSAWVNGTYYAGGGGAAAGSNTGSVGTGGIGGGGNASFTTTAQSGTTNTGGGGGASTGGPWGAGGSGIIIVRYLGSQRGSGGTVSSSGGYTYHTFTSSGTFTA